MNRIFTINRMEIAGSVGDLGTLLPIAMAMVLINGMNPLGLFFGIGLFYILAEIFFGVTVPVQPMKVIDCHDTESGPDSRLYHPDWSVSAHNRPDRSRHRHSKIHSQIDNTRRAAVNRRTADNRRRQNDCRHFHLSETA